MTVLPRGITTRAWYPLSTILVAMALWAGGKSAAMVRSLVSPDPSYAKGWASLSRWTRTKWVMPPPPIPSLGSQPRQRAAELARVYAAYANSGTDRPLIELTYEGARRVMEMTA